MPEFNEVKYSGLLILHRETPEIVGEFVLPGYLMAFSCSPTTHSPAGSVVFHLNGEEFLLDFSASETEETLIAKGLPAKPDEKLQRVFRKFTARLRNHFRFAPAEIQTRVSVLTMAVAYFTNYEGEKRISRPKKATISRNPSTGDLESIKNKWDEWTAEMFTSDEDTSDFWQVRRPGPCIYFGESVQARWTDENFILRKKWGIVGGKYGNGNFGCSGAPDIFGPTDLFFGWIYAAADHDMCQSEQDDHCFQECTLELACAILPTIGSMIFADCNALNPPENLKISAADLERGYYKYDSQHPMDGRKIGTPANWQVQILPDQGEMRWTGPSRPGVVVDSVRAEPYIADDESGTQIQFELFAPAERVVIHLYWEKMPDAIRPVVTLSASNLATGNHSIFWNGIDCNANPPQSGKYHALAIVDGHPEPMVPEVLEFEPLQAIRTEDLLESIQISPNPFSVVQKPTISFSIKERVPVDIFIYHQNWAGLHTRKLIPQISESLQGSCEWDCKNFLGAEAPNGDYKLEFVVNGRHRWVDGLVKDEPQQEGSGLTQTPVKVRVSPRRFSIDRRPRITFELAEPARVSMHIFMLRGQNIIKTLIRGDDLPAGSHTRTWNCRMDGKLNAKAPNGNYRVRLDVNGEVSWVEGLVKVWDWQL